MGKNKILTGKERDAAIQNVIDTVRKRSAEFEVFVNHNWPANVPADCMKLVDGQDYMDCITRNVELCESCATYERLARQFNAVKEIS